MLQNLQISYFYIFKIFLKTHVLHVHCIVQLFYIFNIYILKLISYIVQLNKSLCTKRKQCLVKNTQYLQYKQGHCQNSEACAGQKSRKHVWAKKIHHEYTPFCICLSHNCPVNALSLYIYNIYYYILKENKKHCLCNFGL